MGFSGTLSPRIGVLKYLSTLYVWKMWCHWTLVFFFARNFCCWIHGFLVSSSYFKNKRRWHMYLYGFHAWQQVLVETVSYQLICKIYSHVNQCHSNCTLYHEQKKRIEVQCHDSWKTPRALFAAPLCMILSSTCRYLFQSNLIYDWHHFLISKLMLIWLMIGIIF